MAAVPPSPNNTPQWQQLQTQMNRPNSGEVRSVTPAMNNTRGSARNPSYPSRVPSPTPGASYGGLGGVGGVGGGGGSTGGSTGGEGGTSAANGSTNRMASPQPQRYYGQNGFDAVNITTPAGGGTAGTGTATGTATGIPHQQQQQPQQQQPSSTGLIRLTLRKPMGIVFEPMYDPNQPSVQRGVRICDLPRTGAAALSRRLEIGDELLSINDKTMSRLTFDEIMDFIIEADPEQVNLLFRRPRQEVLAARNALHHSSAHHNANHNHLAQNNNNHNHNHNQASVKWVDDDSKKAAADQTDKKESAKKKDKKESAKKNKKSAAAAARHMKDDDDTLETYEEESRSGKRKKSRKHRDPYENESFLDLLIDTICANPDSVCKSNNNRREDYYSDDEEEDDRTLTSYDDSTYVTYESDKERKKKSSTKESGGGGKDGNKKQRGQAYESETEDDTDDDRRRSKKDLKDAGKRSAKYEDDATLETIETRDRPTPTTIASTPSPLGLAVVPEKLEPPPPPLLVVKEAPPKALTTPALAAAAAPEGKYKAPISELEYDDFDHGADVSVMESLGGPSLLIEKQRQAIAMAKSDAAVPADIINEFGSDYPAAYGLTREQTIHRDTIKFYSFVVKALLEQHEPEKVRLLDKLLAKYKGREDHLVQKLSVRYKRGNGQDEEEGGAFGDFTDAVNTKKESADTQVAVQKAQERAAAAAFAKWPDKETKEADPVDNQKGDEESDGESEFSGDSIDGTSPAVIAQVSELLNYVYGKTSVPGQIDRVSTIMRAYEGREAVLLELLETKALIKANSEKENAANLPSFLRNSPALHGNDGGGDEGEEAELVSPLSTPNMQGTNGQTQQAAGTNIINDDVSSMSGVSSPAPENGRSDEPPSLSKSKSSKEKSTKETKKTSSHNLATAGAGKQQAAAEGAISTPARNEKKKKKFLGGLFGKKNRNKSKDDKPRIRKGGKAGGDGEGSI